MKKAVIFDMDGLMIDSCLLYTSIKNMLEHDQIDILATRVDATKAAYLKKLYPNFNYDKEAKTFILKQSETIQNKGMIVVVCAGRCV